MQDKIRIKYLEDLLRNGTKIELYRFGSEYEDGFACAVTCRNVSCDGQTVVTNRCVLNADTLIDLFREVDKFIFNFSGQPLRQGT